MLTDIRKIYIIKLELRITIDFRYSVKIGLECR